MEKWAEVILFYSHIPLFISSESSEIPKRNERNVMFNRRLKCGVSRFFSSSSPLLFLVSTEEIWKRKNPDLTQSQQKFMVLWPEASNNGNRFRRAFHSTLLANFSKGDAINYHFCLHALTHSLSMPILIKHSLPREIMKWIFAYEKKAVCTKLILLFKTSDLMTAKLFREKKLH